MPVTFKPVPVRQAKISGLVINPHATPAAAGAPAVKLGNVAVGQEGAIDWGCAWVTQVNANAKGMNAITAGTLLAKYAPPNAVNPRLT